MEYWITEFDRVANGKRFHFHRAVGIRWSARFYVGQPSGLPAWVEPETFPAFSDDWTEWQI